MKAKCLISIEKSGFGYHEITDSGYIHTQLKLK